MKARLPKIMILLLTCVSLFGDDDRRLKTEFQDVPPKYIVDNGNPSGISYEIMRLIERKSGYTFAFSNALVPLPRVSKNLADGVMDIQFGLQKTPERERTMVFGPKLYGVSMVGIMRRDDPVTYEKISDIVSRKEIVLTQFGTGAAALLKGVPDLIVDDKATNIELNVEKLLRGRGKVLIYHNLTVNYILKSSKYKDLLRKVEISFEGNVDFTDVDQYLVYSRKVPQSTILAINKAVAEAMASGEIQQIADKYLK